ncbi:L,D-transpeptidase [Paracoccus sp. JM45]|uniref:L,D-transpeptidase family protein n=1 Tax=Paracoccus sp. JM45 TaxID=2283626 RepID=UPI000E6B7A29|nr:L,D-transpeptidase [Paracoccus sp. JM45]RJE80363.1 murein L,D-transpeptidase [Paracoccus sp. JM45]
MTPTPARRYSVHHLTLAMVFGLGMSLPALAQQDLPFTAADIEAAQYGGGDLPRGRTPLTAKVQILLDRSGTSPGVIDGFKGGMSQSAIKAFERRTGLPMDGIMDPHVWNLLQAFSSGSVTKTYVITDADAEGLVDHIPTDYAEKAQMTAMAHTSVAERLGERFHMDEKFIQFLNPGVDLVPGATIQVMAPNPPMRGQVSRIIIDKANRRVAGYDSNGRMVVDYPATIGSTVTPSPEGTHNVRTVAVNPNYTYNPDVNFRQAGNDKPLVVPPGPNGPVGTVWIGLTKPTYGIHGTPTPSQLFSNQSNGCVRLTNWDAEELARMVRIGGTSVEFLDAGVTISDVTGASGATTPPVAAIALPEGTVEPAVPQPAEPLALPDPATAPITEDTTEPQDPAAADPLSNALDSALPDGFVVPPLEQTTP